MKQPVHSSAKSPQQTAMNPAAQPLQHRQPAAGQPGRLGRLAENINQSPRVQAQLKLADEINNSPQVAAHRSLAAEVNAGAAAAQLKRLDEKLKQPKFADAAQTIKKEDLRQHKMADGAVQLAPAPSPNKTGLPDGLKAGVESLSGVSLDSVKVHYNSPKPVQLNALAYAQGTDIHVAPGQQKHLAHEAWHIAQQSQGRVKPTTQAKGVAINDDSSLEREADVMGAKAATMQAKSETMQAMDKRKKK